MSKDIEMKVIVTQEHIDNSNNLRTTELDTMVNYKSWLHCPIAQALEGKYCVGDDATHPLDKQMGGT